MRLLLDTHLFLWSLVEPRKISRKTLTEIEGADVFISAASLWEISIKATLGKLDVDPDRLLDAIEPAGFLLLPVQAVHATRVYSLAPLHRDPFDRLLVAQAVVEGMTLLTVDEQLLPYGSAVRMA